MRADWLVTSVAPYLALTIGSKSDLANRILQLQEGQLSLTIRHVRGRKMSTVSEMFDEFSAALQFPYYFGDNWAAFDECLADLDWLTQQSVAIVLFDSNKFLTAESDALSDVMQLLGSIANEWNSNLPARVGEFQYRPFHVLFHSENTFRDELPDLVRDLPRCDL